MTPRRILVADDNPVSLRFFVDTLAGGGFEIETAGDGEAAVKLATTRSFDGLLFDRHMPRLDGIAALAEIRGGRGPNRCTIAVATTADDDPAAHARLIGAGFGGVLVKPIGTAALREALDRHLRQSGAALLESIATSLDDERALSAAGGDARIVAALRGLLIHELDALPAELGGYALRRDRRAIEERLHRLDASAGFCGAPRLSAAGSVLRRALASDDWSDTAIDDFLQACAQVRTQLAVGIE